MSDDRTSIIQMIGRKRIQPEGGEITLWVADLDKKKISARNQRCNAMLRWFDQYDNCSCYDKKIEKERRWNLIQRVWDAGDTNINKLFRLSNKTIYKNELAEYKINRKIHIYSDILKGNVTFRELVSQWLGKSTSQEQSNPTARLDEFYRLHGECELTDELCDELRDIIVSVSESLGNKEPQPTRTNNLKYEALNNRLKKINSMYRIDKNIKNWILRKEESYHEDEN